MRWFLLITLLCLPTRVALAETSEADKKRARGLAKIATKKLFKKQYSQALRFYEQAYRYWPNPKLHYNIALSHMYMKHVVKAAIHLRKYMKVATVDEKARLPLELRRVLTRVGVLRIKAPARDVAIWIDGRLEGMGYVEVVVLPGKRKVEFRKGAKVVAKKTLNAEGGQTLQYNETGKKVIVKEVVKDSGSSRQKLHWVYFVIASSVAVAAGVVTIGTGVKTLQLHDEFKKNPDDTDVQDQGKTMKTVTNVMIGVTAAAAVAAGVLAIFTRWKSPEKPAKAGDVSVLPTVAPGGAGLSVSLRF